VVDDAIVVVENVHQVMHEENLDAPAATKKAMTQVAAKGPYAWFKRLVDASRKGYVTGSGWMIRWLIIPVLLFAAVITGIFYPFKVMLRGIFRQIHRPACLVHRNFQAGIPAKTNHLPCSVRICHYIEFSIRPDISDIKKNTAHGNNLMEVMD
jgi:multidrug efflux pump subunit AcrB